MCISGFGFVALILLFPLIVNLEVDKELNNREHWKPTEKMFVASEILSAVFFIPSVALLVISSVLSGGQKNSSGAAAGRQRTWNSPDELDN